MDWFRMYGDMPDDPKIGTLSDAEFRTWVELLCAACKANDSGNTGLTKDTVNWALRRDVTVTVTALSQRELVTKNEKGEYVIKAWEKRQYKKDSSAERTRKYRERKSSEANKEAGLERCDDHVTHGDGHSDTPRTDTDTEKNKEKTLSGKPDAVTGESKSEPDPARTNGLQAIEYLNQKTGRRYRPVESNMRMVQARLREGYSLSDVKAVIDRQVGLWGEDKKMQEYLRPATLFAASKFASYAGQVSDPGEGWWSAAGFGSKFEAENAGCNKFICAQFRDGKRIEVAA